MNRPIKPTPNPTKGRSLKTEQKSGFLRDFFIFTGAVYVILSLVSILIGVAESDNEYRYYKNSCVEPVKRIEVVFPAFRLGCWLGKPLKEKR